MVKNGRLWVINIQDFSSKIEKKWRQKICNLFCSFWFNWDLKMFRTSKWPSAPQFCKIFYCRWQKKWQERVIKLQIYEVVSFKHNQSIESWIVKTQLNKSKDSSCTIEDTLMLSFSRSDSFRMSLWNNRFSQNTNEKISEISALASKEKVKSKK